MARYRQKTKYIAPYHLQPLKYLFLNCLPGAIIDSDSREISDLLSPGIDVYTFTHFELNFFDL